VRSPLGYLNDFRFFNNRLLPSIFNLDHNLALILLGSSPLNLRLDIDQSIGVPLLFVAWSMHILWVQRHYALAFDRTDILNSYSTHNIAD